MYLAHSCSRTIFSTWELPIVKKINLFSVRVFYKNMLVVWILPCHHKCCWWYFNYSLSTCFFIPSQPPTLFHVCFWWWRKLVLLIMYFFSPHILFHESYFAQLVIKCDKKWAKKITYVLWVQKIKWKGKKINHYQFYMVCFYQSRGGGIYTQSTKLLILHP